MRDHLATLLDDFRRYGRETAVVRHQGNRRRTASYGDIAHQAGRFAALLASRGIGTGDRVLIWGENSAEWMAAFYGCMLRGALAVPLDASGTEDFAARVAADVSPKLVIGDAELLEKLRGVPAAPAASGPVAASGTGAGGGRLWEANASRGGTQVLELGGVAVETEPGLPDSYLRFEDWNEFLPGEEAGPVEGLSAQTPLEILFTSGTTGEPKGIVLTHGNVLASMGPIEEGSQPYLRYERMIHPLRILHTLPLSHVFGQTMGLWVPHIYRAEVHLESRLVAARLAETIKRERITVLAAVPRVLALLKAHLESKLPGLAERAAALPDRPQKPLDIARRWWQFRDVHRMFGFKFWAFVCGGGALPEALEKFWNALGLVMVQGYGMTETTALITLNHPFHVAQGTLGKPLAGREVKLGPDGEVLVRGASISGATWSHGALHARTDEWLATGDLARAEATGELKFLGRKSETIVTAAGLNIHPEDVEAAIEQAPEVAACAVVGVETPAGMEPFAVLAMRGPADRAGAAMERANAKLAEFQRVRRWAVWPEPDLPRTSSGKVRRKAVADWLAKAPGPAGTNGKNGARPAGAAQDWLLATIAQITGETPLSAEDELNLADDLHLDSLGRVQLAAEIEERLGTAEQSGLLDQAQTLGDLRRLVAAGPSAGGAPPASVDGARNGQVKVAGAAAQEAAPELTASATGDDTSATAAAPATYIYPRWPWWSVFRAIRVAFLETVIRPVVWFLANPKTIHLDATAAQPSEPMLIVPNHVLSVDTALVEYGLPPRLRRRLAVAMSGEMLEDFRHFRNPEAKRNRNAFYPLGPIKYVLATALFNVFPLPRQRDFQRSFAHTGEALDAGFNVIVYPEGQLSPDGRLGRFRPGIGLLVKQSRALVLPIALRGVAELLASGKGWFRSGRLEVVVGRPIRFAATDSEAEITARLQAEVEKLLEGEAGDRH